MPSIGIHGSKATFFIPFPKNADGSYPDSLKITDLSIGAMKHPITLPEYEYKQDVKYLITVTGEQEDNLQLSSVQEVGKAEIKDLLQ